MSSRDEKLVLPTMICLAIVCLAASGGKQEFRYDFRQKTMPPGSLQPVGKTPQRYIRPQSNGLKISLPGGTSKQPLPQTGVKFNRVVLGDFEISLGYELNQVEKPTVGYGSGVSVSLQTDSPRKTAATLAALRPVSGEIKFVASLHSTAADGKRSHDSKAVPGGDSARKGTLRLIRKGGELQCLATEADDSSPKALRTLNLGIEPVTVIRLVADPGGSSTGVDITLTDLDVKADKLTMPSEQLMRSSSSARWIIFAGVAFALVVGWAFVWKRGQHQPTR